jgi:2-C-methyl-D-erythritol 4-phosphate cytidylyltransferase
MSRGASDQYAIIVAGGSGSRMNSRLPKQFLKLGKMPVLMHTLLAFYEYSQNVKMVLVLPEKEIHQWNSLCRKYDFPIPVKLQKGGATRFQSVRNGLTQIGDSGVVAIHDGVRPLVEKEIISASYEIASLHGCAIAAVRLKESIRETDKDKTRSADRSKFRIIQTPQTFRIPIIKKAYEMEESDEFTDDASVAEKAGFTISLFEGSYLNIKITTPEDLEIARALLRFKQSKERINIRPR